MKNSTLLERFNQRKFRRRLEKTVLFVIATLITLVFLFPIYWMVISSLKSSSELFSKTPTFFPHKLSLEGYQKMFGTQFVGQTITTSLRNSFIISILTAIITTILATFTAYGLVRFRYASNKFLLLVFLLAQMMPTVLFLSPLYLMLKELNISGTLLAPALFVTMHSVPFSVLLLRPYFLNVPNDIEDAATVDGCNKFTAFTKVILPMVYPGVLVIAVLSFLWGWGDMVGALTFCNTSGLRPLSLDMYRAMSGETTDWQMLMAFATVLVIPTIVLFLALQKHIIKGLTSGAVKG